MNKYIYLTLITLTASLIFGFNEINDLSNNLDLNDLDPQLNNIYPNNFCGWVEMETSLGAGKFERVYKRDPSGSAVNPKKDEAILEKAKQLMGEFLLDNRITAIKKACLNLESMNTHNFVDLLKSEKLTSVSKS